MSDWNPTDPDAVSVAYDLSAWTFDQQGELAAELAEAEVPHAWDGTELVVPEDYEQAADLLIADVEARLGIEQGPPSEIADAGPPPEPIALADDVATTEYSLEGWPDDDVEQLRHALAGARIPHRIEGELLLVPTDDEEVVEELLDDVEMGEYVDPDEPPAGGEGGDAGALTAFFLAAERLRNDPLDPDGLEQLLAATDDADPERPPFGVAPRLWQRTTGLADALVDALTEGDEPDRDGAMDAATELHDLLRQYV